MRPVESFVGQPIRSLQTMLRVIAENDPRHETIVPDGIYGPETISAVSAFQRLHGLQVTGITDQPTWEAIVAQYKPALINIDEAQPIEVILNPNQIIRRGERHPVIYLTQGILAVLSEVHQSIAAPGMNGILDTATADSLSSFQQLHSLPMTGELDKQTWQLLALQFPLAQNLYFSR
jgi:peptidoglycan hydrolase-like protein with peptidoglycan-binding domain